jgi:hypothetical protein
MNVNDLMIGTRARGVPGRAGIETVEDLCRLTAHQVRNLGNCGEKTLVSRMPRGIWSGGPGSSLVTAHIRDTHLR